MPSPRYLAEAFILPRFLKERGAAAVLDAMERNEPDYFIPVWMEAGFRFNTMLFHRTLGSYRIGVLTFPMPRESTEAYLGIIVGSPTNPSLCRYLLWELATPLGFEGETGTVIGEWSERGHGNFGRGPAFTGNLQGDMQAVLDRVIEILGQSN